MEILKFIKIIQKISKRLTLQPPEYSNKLNVIFRILDKGEQKEYTAIKK